MKKNISYIAASFFGAGHAPFASGTFGSAAALPFAYIAAVHGAFWWFIIGTYIIGTLASREVLKHEEHDPPVIVIDEACGQAIALLPAAFDWRLWVAGFVLFRLFDIAKPWPCSFFDKRVLNEHGVMLDDVFAGIYAAAGVWLCAKFLF